MDHDKNLINCKIINVTKLYSIRIETFVEFEKGNFVIGVEVQMGDSSGGVTPKFVLNMIFKYIY